MSPINIDPVAAEDYAARADASAEALRRTDNSARKRVESELNEAMAAASTCTGCRASMP
jgi:hypothetical protein